MSELRDTPLTVVAYVGMNEIAACREFWLDNQRHPNADFEFFDTVVRNRPEVESPAAFAVVRDGAMSALAAARIERVPLTIALGYLTIANQTVRRLTFIHGGMIGRWDRNSMRALTGFVRDFMRLRRIDVVLFSSLNSTDEVARTVRAETPFLQRDHFSRANAHWSMQLPGRYDDFLKRTKSKHRTYLRGCEKKLEKAYGSVSSEVFTTGSAAFCESAERIASKTYHRKMGAGFVDNKELRERLALLEKRQGFRGYIFSAGTIPCAFWLGTLYKETFYLDYTGYDPQFTSYAPGQILFLKMIEDLCASGAVTAIDFGSGDAAYKQRFGDKSFDEFDVCIFRGSAKMICLNLLQTLINALRVAFEHVVDKGNIKARIKKIWRSKMQRDLDHSHGDAAHE